jgi:hypothetical protein
LPAAAGGPGRLGVDLTDGAGERGGQGGPAGRGGARAGPAGDPKTWSSYRNLARKISAVSAGRCNEELVELL